MITSISQEKIIEQLLLQLSSIFFISEEDKMLINTNKGCVFSRCEYCFSKTLNKYYHIEQGETFFNPYHSGQYTVFLYYLSNSIYRNSNAKLLSDKIYYLNKMLNSCDLFYEVELPEFFTLDHPVGSVIGRAQFGEGFSFSQNCTVGNNKGIYPIIGENVKMCANSSIIGNSIIGSNSIIGANSGVKDENVPANSLVFGYSPNLIIKQIKQ
jgi:serine O-acetyltransferase